MFAIQRLSERLRPGTVESGPPYKPSGTVWGNIALHATIPEADAGLKRILAPTLGSKAGDPERYRIRRVK